MCTQSPQVQTTGQFKTNQRRDCQLVEVALNCVLSALREIKNKAQGLAGWRKPRSKRLLVGGG